jgi:hypothetical protein
MKASDYIHREVSPDGERLSIEFLDGPSVVLTYAQALALREILDEQLPNMAVDLSRNQSHP